MKVSIGFKVRSGPWGGGNRFAKSLSSALIKDGWDVSFDLKDPDLDIILLTDPRPNSNSAGFNHIHILRYILLRNPKTIIVHRINECDERKDTKHVNKALIAGNQCADHTVFIGQWLDPLLHAQGLNPRRSSTIYNGADKNIFHADGYPVWNGHEPLKLVTHHWGAHWKKGFDIYQKLDQMLGQAEWRDKFSFTYIGNLPHGFSFKNSTYLPPKDGIELAAALKQNHVYLTASINEPGGNHQHEGAACGLPLLYRKSGALPEQCAGYGIEFTAETFLDALQQIQIDYPIYQPKMAHYPHTKERMTTQYGQLFQQLLAEREEILAERKQLPQWPLWRQAIQPTKTPRQIASSVKKWLLK